MGGPGQEALFKTPPYPEFSLLRSSPLPYPSTRITRHRCLPRRPSAHIGPSTRTLSWVPEAATYYVDSRARFA